jgi:integrase
VSINATYRIFFIRPRAAFGNIERLHSLAGVTPTSAFHARLFELPLVAIIVDDGGAPVWEPTLFLAETAINSRSIMGDTVRTYAEALLPWLCYLKERDQIFSRVTEETLGEYRAQISHAVNNENGRKYASSTVNQRVVVPAVFHEWGQRRGAMSSPLGAYLERNPTGPYNRIAIERRRPLPKIRTPRVIRRLPTALSIEQLRRLMLVTPMPYRLMLRWCLATGMRRIEVSNLRLSDLPTPEQIASCSDGILRIQILRKGSREHTVHVPASLLEETNWFVLTDRLKPAAPSHKDFVFINRRGSQILRPTMSRCFRKSADAIGTEATLHHLRHTFAVHVLGILERRHSEGEELNSLKTLQVLLGHASLESTEIYLQAVQTSGDAVIEALDYLYGSVL